MAAKSYRRTRLVLVGAFAAAVVGGSVYFNGGSEGAPLAPASGTNSASSVSASIQEATPVQRQPASVPSARRSRGS